MSQPALAQAGPLCTIAVPTFGKISTLWSQRFHSLQAPLGAVCEHLFDPDQIDIAAKRNRAVEHAIARGSKTLFFVGDDVHVPAEGLQLLLKRWREGALAVTGVYWTKNTHPEPYIYRGYMQGAYFDWKVGEFFEIDWAGCDCLLLDVEMLKGIPQPWFSLDYTMAHEPPADAVITVPGRSVNTEDLYFYSKLKDKGVKLWCDAAIQCQHEDRNTGMLYGVCDGMPQRSREPVATKGKLVADIGCGRRLNPLYQDNTVVRFDMDESVKPDYRCDVRSIPMPDDHFDLAEASHVLEHLTLNDTIATIQEWVRILKPGGTLTIKVPNLAYAARRLIADTEYVLDPRWPHPYELLMVYGSQDGPGMFHRAGFTKNILRDYAERAAGDLCDIEVIETDFVKLADGTSAHDASELTLTLTKREATPELRRVAESFVA